MRPLWLLIGDYSVNRCRSLRLTRFRANGRRAPLLGIVTPLPTRGRSHWPRTGSWSSTALTSRLQLRREASAGLGLRFGTRCQPVDIRATENSMGVPSLQRRIGVIAEGELDAE